MLSGSHFTSQVIFGFILGFFWGHYFYVYLRGHIYTFIADIIVYPNSRQRATKYYMIITYGIIILGAFLCHLRTYFRNEVEYEKILGVIKENCNHFYKPEDQSLKDCFIMIFPMVLLLIYGFVNMG